MPMECRKKLTAGVKDLGELLGAIRFLGNILYVTDDEEDLRYYREREWRIIANLSEDNVRQEKKLINEETLYSIKTYEGKHIVNCLEEVVVIEDPGMMRANKIRSILRQHRYNGQDFSTVCVRAI